MSTRKSLIAQAARELGWRTGSIASGTATTAVLDGYFEGDAAAYEQSTLVMPDAANTADKARLISSWAPSTLTATWSGNRTDTTYTSETYFLKPSNDITLEELNTALNDVLAECRFTVESCLPTVDGERYYRLGRFSWIRYRDDVVRYGVMVRRSPNLLSNSLFDAWGSGAAAAPNSWTLAGSGATVARATTAARGYYGVTLTRVGADATLTQSVGTLNGQLAGKEVTFQCYVRATVASRGRIGITDGTTYTYSSYHTGGGTDELLTVTATLASTATACNAILSVDTGNTSVTFSGAAFVEGDTVPDALTDTGDTAYQTEEVQHKLITLGDQVAIELAQPIGRGAQLVIKSDQPYPALSADSDSTDCPDSLAIHGLIDQVVSRYTKGVARDRLEALRVRHHNQFIQLSKRRRDPAAAETPHRIYVSGA